jgi:hypothetical protein
VISTCARCGWSPDGLTSFALKSDGTVIVK